MFSTETIGSDWLSQVAACTVGRQDPLAVQGAGLLARRGTDVDTYARGVQRRDLHNATLTALVDAARGGDDQEAWNELVRRFKALVWKVGRKHLSASELDDHSARTWFKLVMSLSTVRDAERLPGWVARVASNEAKAVLRNRRGVVLTDTVDDRADIAVESLDADLMASELRAAVDLAFEQIPPECQRLLDLLTADPPLSYDEIATILDVPRGSIGPSRQRCLNKLRLRPAMAPYVKEVRP